MSLKVVRGKTLPIGVDMGMRMLKLVQLRVVEGNLELFAAESTELPPAAREDHKERMSFLPSAIHQMMISGCFKGRQAIIALPAEATFIHHVRTPKLSSSVDVEKAVRQELSGKVPFDITDAIIRNLPAGEIYGDGESKQEHVVVAVSKDTLNEYLAVARKAHLDVIGVNIEACAIVECFSRLFRRNADMVKTTMFLDIGSASTQVVLAGGTKISFARNLAIGGNTLDQALAKARQISLADAYDLRIKLSDGKTDSSKADQLYKDLSVVIDSLVEEITQCLRYYESVFRNQSIERAIFVGGLAYDKGLCQLLAKRLNLPAQIGDPLVLIKRPDDAPKHLDWRNPQPAWAVAVGLSAGSIVAA